MANNIKYLLKISSPWGTSYQFADWVWSVLDEYGFGAVERIINFFQTEDMQNRLANVILNDAELQEDLNLDTPDNPDYNSSKGLNYLAVAKVGILTFADYIHDIYIADGGWREDTWNWIFDPGYTLVDLVDAALGAIGDAVNAVKNAATSFVNGVKAGLQYVSNALINGIFSVIELGAKGFTKGLGGLLEFFVSGFTVTSSDYTYFNFNSESYPIGIKKSDQDLMMKLGPLDFLMEGLFDGEMNIAFNGEKISNQIGPQDGFIPPIDAIVPSYFDDVAWEYIAMELLKELVLTYSFTLTQALLLIKRPFLATASHISALLLSYLGSMNLFNSLKNDPDLTYNERMATIYMLYNIHLDFSIGGILDTGLEIFSGITKSSDLSGLGNFASLVIGSTLQNTISYPLFESWNPNTNWNISPGSSLLVRIIDVSLAVLGGKQMSALFDESITLVGKMTRAFARFSNTQSHPQIVGLLSEVTMSHNDQLWDNSLNPREFHKILLAFALIAYHTSLTFYWGKIGNQL